MPRGNDKEGQEKALHELADEFAANTGNAESLIDANAARRTADLNTVSDLKVDPVATAELDLDSLEGPNGEYVVDAVVRRSGRSSGTIVIYQDENGRLEKHLVDAHLGPAVGIGGERDEEGVRRSTRAKAKPDEKADDK